PGADGQELLRARTLERQVMASPGAGCPSGVGVDLAIPFGDWWPHTGDDSVHTRASQRCVIATRTGWHSPPRTGAAWGGDSAAPHVPQIRDGVIASRSLAWRSPPRLSSLLPEVTGPPATPPKGRSSRPLFAWRSPPLPGNRIPGVTRAGTPRYGV